MNPAVSRAEVEADIKETLGLVPHFFSVMPDELLAPEWEIFKMIEFAVLIAAVRHVADLAPAGMPAESVSQLRQLLGDYDQQVRGRRVGCTWPAEPGIGGTAGVIGGPASGAPGWVGPVTMAAAGGTSAAAGDPPDTESMVAAAAASAGKAA